MWVNINRQISRLILTYYQKYANVCLGWSLPTSHITCWVFFLFVKWQWESLMRRQGGWAAARLLLLKFLCELHPCTATLPQGSLIQKVYLTLSEETTHCCRNGLWSAESPSPQSDRWRTDIAMAIELNGATSVKKRVTQKQTCGRSSSLESHSDVHLGQWTLTWTWVHTNCKLIFEF